MGRVSLRRAVLTLSFALALAGGTALADEKPLRIGVVTFLSGPAASPFGIPSRNAAEILVEGLNQAAVPAPYSTRGIGGRPIELVFVDEAGGPAKQEAEFKSLAERVDLVIGYISSGDCLAVAPLAEKLRKLTVLFDCGTPRIFEDSSYKYVFRTAAHATMDSVGAALYVSERLPQLKKFAGINQNYAWGQDNWRDFELSMKSLEPHAQVTSSQMPKLWAGEYSSEIAAVLAAKPDVVHSSFWGSDLEALVLQAEQRGMFKKSLVVLTAGETAMYRQASKIPNGTVVGARGPNGIFAPDNALNRWLQQRYQDRYWLKPTYPAYHMVQAILGVKAAYEKAQAGGAAVPTQAQIIAAFEGLTFETPSGKVQMTLGKGHQAVQGTAYGIYEKVRGQVRIRDVKHYPPERGAAARRHQERGLAQVRPQDTSRGALAPPPCRSRPARPATPPEYSNVERFNKGESTWESKF